MKTFTHTIIKNILSFIACSFLLFNLGCEADLPPKEQYETFAKEIEQAIKEGEIGSIHQKFNSSLFMKNLREKIVLPAAERNAIKVLIKDHFYENLEEVRAKYSEKNRGILQFDTVYFEDRTAHLVFSMISNEGEVNFVDFYVNMIDNQLFISDYLNYFSGVRLSRELHQAARDFHLQGSNPNQKDHKSYVESNNLLTVVIPNLYRTGECNQAWQLFDQIDERFHKKVSYLALKMAIGGCSTPNQYESVAKEFINHELITDQSKAFHQLLIAVGRHDMTAFDQARTRLKQFIGTNANITLLKALTLINEGEYEGAKVYLDRCFNALDNALYTHELKLSILIGLGKVEEAQACFETIIKQFDVDADYLNMVLEVYPMLDDRTDTSI